MTTFQIHTADHHRAEIARLEAQQQARRERDVYDVALSSWAADCLIERHETALEALEAGDGVHPAAEVFGLWHGDRLVSTERETDRYGTDRWVLTPEQRRELDRYAVPCGARSRVQRALGLHEERRTVAVQPCFRVVGSGIGGAESYRFSPA